jgi:CRISPR-associated endonuclease/helicase Cas3
MYHAKSYRAYWGKAKPTETQSPIWHPFAYHSLDVAAVAAALWDRSPAICRAFASAFKVPEDGSGRLRAWVLFFIALHDIGKLLALFQIKAPEAAALAWPGLDARKLQLGAGKGYHHGPEGFRLVKQDLIAWTGTPAGGKRKVWSRWAPWVAAVTGHHGDIPGEDDEGSAPKGYADPPIRDQDTAARRSWAEQAAALFLAPERLGLTDLPPDCDVPARNLLAGFCSLCDWVGSNTTYFPYRVSGVLELQYFADRLREIEQQDILAQLGLVAPILPYGGVPALLRDGENPRGIQVLVDTLSLAPGLTIIEAPTGSGKTEAALAHAWRLLAAGTADSIVFALPTQATANAMLARAEAFAGRAFGTANLVLAHGNSRLNREYQRLVDAGRASTAQGPEEASVQCAAWLASSRKRVFLGQVGVCTVDQTLLSVLPVRHNFVRGLGLNRSVLIVDEVHAYDAYMNGLLGVVLRRQKATGGSAILLSATLPAKVRSDLLAAWGTEGDAEAPYPAVWTTQERPATPLTVPDPERPLPRAIAVDLAKQPKAFPDAALIERILSAGHAGALVGIVMNTVDEAQCLTRLLRRATDLPVDLFHARFRLKDRQGIEQAVIDRYGREAVRSGGRILVATQVIEQSLDLDFDWMLTQICPVDLLFQRLGRLHRHDGRCRPDGFQRPACTFLCPEGNDYGVFELIYGDARLLWRTERLLAERDRIEFPGAYRDWIERVYAEDPWDDEPDDLYGKHLAYRDTCKDAADRARRLTAMSISQFGDDDERATSLTRDGEMSLTVLPLLDNGKLLDGESLKAMEDHDQAEALHLNSTPAPHSWKDPLAGFEWGEDGRIRLPMVPISPGAWASADGSYAYSVDFGLEKGGTSGQDDPTHTQPR